MEFREVKNQNEWEAFVFFYGPRSGAFLESVDWGMFQESLGRKTIRIGGYQNGILVVAAQAIEYRLPFGQRYFFLPRGPIFSDPEFFKTDAVKSLFVFFKKELGAMFLRYEPPVEFLIGKSTPSSKKSIDINMPRTILLDLSRDYETLLQEMHTKTRYNIRLAERKGVEIDLVSSASFEKVWPLFETTASRGQFRLHQKNYYAALLKTCSEGSVRAFLATARYAGEVVAANVMVDAGSTRTYLHGASSDKHRDVMAPYLLHDALIQDAQVQNLSWYDFWGIAPEGSGAEHHHAGITRFKKGFGGEEVQYPGTYDYVFRPGIYKTYGLVRQIRRSLPF